MVVGVEVINVMVMVRVRVRVKFINVVVGLVSVTPGHVKLD